MHNACMKSWSGNKQRRAETQQGVPRRHSRPGRLCLYSSRHCLITTGQRLEPRHILNLSAKGTLESYVLEVLQAKISMFHLVIGEMDQILGNLDWTESFEQRVFRLWAQHAQGKELEQAFTSLGSELETARQRYEHVKAYDQEIFEGADGGGG